MTELENLRRLLESQETFAVALEMCEGLNIEPHTLFPEFKRAVDSIAKQTSYFLFWDDYAHSGSKKTYILYSLLFSHSVEIEGGADISNIDFSLFKAMTTLRFEYCQISAANIQSLAKCERLKELSLYFCGLQSLPDLSNFKLEILTVKRNSLNSMPKLPDTIKQLDIAYNSFKIVPDLSYLPNLVVFSMYNNKITDLPEWIIAKKDWDSLNFGCCQFPWRFVQFSNAIDQLLVNNPNLKHDFTGYYFDWTTIA